MPGYPRIGDLAGARLAFPKPDPALVDLLHDAADALPSVEVRRMFGCPALFHVGQMMGGVFADCLFVRLPADARAAALARPGFHTFSPMEGRPMGEYVCLPRALAEDPRALRGWLEQGVAYARTLPPKAEKKPKSPKAPKATTTRGA